MYLNMVTRKDDIGNRSVGHSIAQSKKQMSRDAGYQADRRSTGNVSRCSTIAQMSKSAARVKSLGEKILNDLRRKSPDLEQSASQRSKSKSKFIDRAIQLKAIHRSASKQEHVVQRLVNAPINLNNPYTFWVVPADLGTGTLTTPATRAYVNHPATPKHLNVDWAYGVWNGMGGIIALNNGTAPNPAPPPGGNYDAGHSLGRQNGGLGCNNAWVFPQDQTVNRGWGGTFPAWRAHENAFNVSVAMAGAGGFGLWDVLTY